ncbi:GRB2-related adapter protein-like isoform X1 [Thalassophryne amazonica]|uniref:GRB2-related adapter protein-like isoform X1 n=1 Tax=Thalassophryne amazonica TaxID=390379 RepID=UPI001471FDB8|nr:GRB2-related adapter protein-like isoform X1 [Thalassophryne amazonica]
MEATALFSFTASESDEISFHKGDIIKVIDAEEDSYWVTAEVHGRRGYVPQNYISLLPHPWFAGSVSRQEAEQRLRRQASGVFLIRESESAPGEFSLSVSYGDKVEHFRVLEGASQYCIWDESFCSLNQLVDFYRTHSIAVEKAVYLRDAHWDTLPPLTSHTSCNPYPNPYKSSCQESLLYIHSMSHQEKEPSLRLLETSYGESSTGSCPLRLRTASNCPPSLPAR